MILYCGLRHFYVQHLQPTEGDAYYILTHNGEIWDFSPELKNHGFTPQNKRHSVFHLDRPVLTTSIDLKDFQPFTEAWHDFSRQYTTELEVEYPHAWYLRFKQASIAQQFIVDFDAKLKQEQLSGIWGGGQSKLVAKLAAHNLNSEQRVIPSEQTQAFLSQLPLHRLPLPEFETLEKLGLKTIGELASLPLAELQGQFGSRASILQRLGRGEDLLIFQAEPISEYTWVFDCTTCEGFLRPLIVHELLPYLSQGMAELATSLHIQGKVAALLTLKATLAHGNIWEKERKLKTATNDANVLIRNAESLLPEEPLAQIQLAVGDLSPAPQSQLTIFWEPPKRKPELHDLPTQVGLELSRRERLLILWKEAFS